MPTTFVRVLRTPTSERFLIQSDGRDSGACDLHFLEGGKVAGTVILLADGPLASGKLEDLLRQLDDQLLPHVSLGDKNLTFTVVHGTVVGNFTPDA